MTSLRRIAATCRALAALAVLASVPAGAVTAPEVSDTGRAEVRLIADAAVAAPGDRVRVALHQVLAEKWHTYWINPGDSGLAPAIAWELPDGVTVGGIRWPAPVRVPFGPLMNYGFNDEAVLISDLTIPADWPAGKPVRLTAEADWLICADICVPEAQRFTLEIPTAAEGSPDAALAPVFARGEASQPRPAPELPVTWDTDGDDLRLAFRAPELTVPGLTDLTFFPETWGLVSHPAPQRVTRVGDTLVIRVARGDAWLSGTVEGPVAGVLRGTDTSAGTPVHLALAVTAEQAPLPAALAAAEATSAADAATPLAILTAAALAALGGVLLNLMPCVFPVLALKALSFASHSTHGAGVRRVAGLSYGAGVMVTFLSLAGLLIGLKAAGAAIGWGFQLQSAPVVAVLAYVLFVVGLGLSGVVELPARFAGVGDGLTRKPGVAGSFFTGVLAVVVASPCTAPFMGAALGFGLTQSAPVTLVIFAGLALGFAAPMVALTLSPALARRLPRPGPWMTRFRQALAFPMYLAAAWLVWVLGELAGIDAVFAVLIGMILLALAGWALGSGAPVSRRGRLASGIAAVLALLGAAAALTPALGSGDGVQPVRALAAGAERYSPARLAALRAEGRPVFLNFTADWCISCKVNERLVLKSDAVAETLAATDAVYMVGDWTRRDGEILAVLQQFGRAGVPLYLVYPADGGAPEVLPQILTRSMVTEALETAAATGLARSD